MFFILIVGVKGLFSVIFFNMILVMLVMIIWEGYNNIGIKKILFFVGDMIINLKFLRKEIFKLSEIISEFSKEVVKRNLYRIIVFLLLV